MIYVNYARDQIGYNSQIMRKTVYIGLTLLLRYNGKAVPGKVIKEVNPHTIVGTEKIKIKTVGSARPTEEKRSGIALKK